MSGEELRVSGTEPTPENELSQEPTLLNGSENGQERVWSENVVQLCQTDQVKELQTILKDRSVRLISSKNNYMFQLLYFHEFPSLKNNFLIHCKTVFFLFR